MEKGTEKLENKQVGNKGTGIRGRIYFFSMSRTQHPGRQNDFRLLQRKKFSCLGLGTGWRCWGREDGGVYFLTHGDQASLMKLLQKQGDKSLRLLGHCLEFFRKIRSKSGYCAVSINCIPDMGFPAVKLKLI